MKKAWRYFGQGLGYLLFIAFIGYFSTEPTFTNLPLGDALIKFTLAHPGKRLVPCEKRAPEELAKLPPRKRFKMVCSRERSPLQVELLIDDRMVYQAEIPARGLRHDLPSPIYQRFAIPAGQHRLLVRMRDDVRDKDFTYSAERTVALAPLQILIVDFDNTTEKFIFM